MAKEKFYVLRNSKDIAKALGITSPVDIALMEFKSDLSTLAVNTIKHSGLSVNEIVKRSDVARSKVSAIKNGALVGISIDLFLKVILAAGGKINMKLSA